MNATLKKTMIPILIGALAGFGYWYFFGCTNGCAITSSPWRSSVYGAFMGYFAFGSLPKKFFTPRQKTGAEEIEETKKNKYKHE